MYAERRLTLNTVLWSKYFMFKNVFWFPYISSCGLRLDEHPFNASIVPNDNVCRLLTTRLQRPVNMSLLWGKTWMFCPCHVNMNCHFIHYAVIFTKPHLKFQMFENLSGSRSWLLFFLNMSMWSSCHRWWTGGEWRRWSERVILCVLMALQCVSTSAQTMTWLFFTVRDGKNCLLNFFLVSA